MIYGIVDGGEKVLPQKNIHAFCPHCKNNLIAKCGRIKAHHWAHKEAKGCPYSYGMTYWHYKWLQKFDALKSQGWEIEYFYNSIRFDAFHPSKKQAIEFQRSIDLDYIKNKIQICNNAGIKLFWLINPQVFESFIYTKRFENSKGDIIYSKRRCTRRIMLLLEDFIHHPNTLFLIDFTKKIYLPHYATDRVDICSNSYQSFKHTDKEKHPMTNGIYIAKDLPFINDGYYRNNSVIALRYHKSKFIDNESDK